MLLAGDAEGSLRHADRGTNFCQVQRRVGIRFQEFNESIIKYPSMKRFPGGASNDLLPDLQHPENPVPAGWAKDCFRLLL